MHSKLVMLAAHYLRHASHQFSELKGCLPKTLEKLKYLFRVFLKTTKFRVHKTFNSLHLDLLPQGQF